MTIEDAKKLEQFLCSECSSDEDAKGQLNSFRVSPSAEVKVITADGIPNKFCFF